jgi:DNA mismatch repair protein MutS2
MGRELVSSRAPLTQAPAISAALRETRRARLALGAAGSPPWGTLPDARGLLADALVPGSVLDGTDLVTFIPLLEASVRLRAYGRGIQPVAPEIASAFLALPVAAELHQRLQASLEEDGRVTDAASPTLRRIRERLRNLRHDIRRRLEAYFGSPTAEATFQERYVTVRHGRYVLPVLAAAKGRVRGIVHDRSQSGATLFIEPEAVIEHNNELVQGEREEEAEVLQVLAELTDAVREAAPVLSALIAGVGELDLVFARAELAERMAAVEPVIDESRTVAIDGARHPLLVAQGWTETTDRSPRSVVPIDLHLDAARPVLVVTGPNAGGKTVALKTLGLLVLMAQSGCHLPAREGCRLPAFSRLFAIIGDDQSVAENLSTYSAFVKQLRTVLDEVDDRSLVLLDELGAGTDPDDGAALAQAVLEALADRGALCMATTHLEPLKGFAATFAGARNASVEFDAMRLEPTFRLVYDRPGQSYALAIGARLGLPAPLIEHAQAYRSTQARALQDLLARLDAQDRQDAERTARIAVWETDLASLLPTAEAEPEAARVKARDTLARAREESERMLADVRRAVNEEWDRLRRAEQTRETLEQSRRRLREIGRSVGYAGADVRGEADGEPARAGDRVTVAHLGLTGEVLSVDGSQATVQAGAVTVKVPVQGLQVVHRAGRADGAQELASRLRARQEHGPVRRRGIRLPDKSAVPTEIRLIGRTTEEARDVLEKYLDDAFLAGLATVRIVHGKGTGALRRAVHDLLAQHPLVEQHRAGSAHEGGDGATVAQLRIA